MSFAFGEINFESSQAFADDEDEGDDSQIGLELEWTETGMQNQAKILEDRSLIFFGFVGKVALGFGEGFLKGSSSLNLVAEVYVTGSEGAVDMCSLKRSRKKAARIFYGNGVIFALIDFYGVPRFLSNELVGKISEFLLASREVVVFHSSITAYAVVSKVSNWTSFDGKLFYLTNSKYPSDSIPNDWNPLPPPNMISGPSAAILTHCEKVNKKGLLLVAFSETELVDSISMKPYFGSLKKSISNSVNALEVLSKLDHSLNHSVQCNLSSVADSNLYL